MKYIVMVNQKYLVSVEAESAGGAEHKILDNVFYGIKTCQAFTLKELGTDFFRGCAERCETISYSELFNKAVEYKEVSEAIAREEENIACYRKQIEDLRNDIKCAEEEISSCSDSMKELQHKVATIL